MRAYLQRDDVRPAAGGMFPLQGRPEAFRHRQPEKPLKRGGITPFPRKVRQAAAELRRQIFRKIDAHQLFSRGAARVQVPPSRLKMRRMRLMREALPSCEPAPSLRKMMGS